MAVPTLFAIGALPAWEMVASALMCVIAPIATGWLAGLVYQRSVMQTSSRVKLRQALRAGAH